MVPYFCPRLTLALRVLLVIGGIHCLTANATVFPNILGPVLARVLALAIGIAAVVSALDRNYYLPFLGECVVGGITEGPAKDTPKNFFTLQGLPAQTRVLYWSAQEGTSAFPDPKTAYGDYSNSGMTVSSSTGEATVALPCPAGYSVRSFLKKEIPPHFHYRYELPDFKGVFSKVFTYDLKDQC